MLKRITEKAEGEKGENRDCSLVHLKIFQVAVKEEQKWEGKGGCRDIRHIQIITERKREFLPAPPKYMRG